MQKDHPYTVKKKFTKKILDSLKNSKENRIREGEVYCIRYEDSQFPTDKWHQLAIVYITEVRDREVEGYNLLYLKDSISKKILEAAAELKIFKGSSLYRDINEMNRTTWSYARKSFVADKIVKFVQINRSLWEQLVGIERKPFGDVNGYKLMVAWYEENKEEHKEIRRKRKEGKDPFEKETLTIEEDMNTREMVFGASGPKENLRTLTKEIVDFDDDDI